MGLLDRFFGQKPARPAPRATPEQLRQALLLTPALIRIGIAQKNPEEQAEALVRAAAETSVFENVKPAIIYAMISASTRSMMAQGIPAAMEGIRSALDAEECHAALHLAITSAMLSPSFDEGDLEILSGIARDLGVSESEFEAFHESVRSRRNLH